MKECGRRKGISEGEREREREMVRDETYYRLDKNKERLVRNVKMMQFLIVPMYVAW